MKRALLIPVLVLAIITMACAFSAGQTGQPTQVAGGQSGSATEAPLVVLATATTAAIPTPEAKGGFLDNFDQDSKVWAEPFVVSTQAKGGVAKVTSELKDGALRFSIPDKETYAYKFLLNPVEGSQTIELNYQNKGKLNNGIAIVCKVNKELSSWFEVRITSQENNLNIYQYDKKLKTDEGKNPFVKLGGVHMQAKEFQASNPNHVVVTCKSDQILVDLNNGKKTFTQAIKTPLEGNVVGLGVLSFDATPVTVDFDAFAARQEQ